MAKASMTITIDPASELARALADAEMPVILESDGVRYSVAREDVVPHFDAAAVQRGLRESRGALHGVDVETLLEDLGEQRRQDPVRRPN